MGYIKSAAKLYVHIVNVLCTFLNICASMFLCMQAFAILPLLAAFSVVI